MVGHSGFAAISSRLGGVSSQAAHMQAMRRYLSANYSAYRRLYSGQLINSLESLILALLQERATLSSALCRDSVDP